MEYKWHRTVTVIGNHLKCDCSKVIKRSSCPRPLVSPITKKDNFYYHCPQCKLDFSCNQATKPLTEKDKFGYPVTDHKVCRKCETKLEIKNWPLD